MIVGYDVPASGSSGSVVVVGLPLGVDVGLSLGVGVALPDGVGVGLPLGVGVGLPDGVGVALPDGVGVVNVKVRALQPSVAALGLLVGAVGATDSCLN